MARRLFMVVVAGAVPVSTPGVTGSAMALLGVQALERPVEPCGQRFRPLPRCCASLAIL
jgi:hypothetical protein